MLAGAGARHRRPDEPPASCRAQHGARRLSVRPALSDPLEGGHEAGLAPVAQSDLRQRLAVFLRFSRAASWHLLFFASRIRSAIATWTFAARSGCDLSMVFAAGTVV